MGLLTPLSLWWEGETGKAKPAGLCPACAGENEFDPQQSCLKKTGRPEAFGVEGDLRKDANPRTREVGSWSEPTRHALVNPAVPEH